MEVVLQEGLVCITKGFTFEDVYKLAATLHYMFGL